MRTGDRYLADTPAGTVDIRVMRANPDGTVDILCTCCGARWERRSIELSADGLRLPRRAA